MWEVLSPHDLSGWTVVFYIFAVAAMNLGLGFAVAVLLARRYRVLSCPATERTASVSADVDFDEPAGTQTTQDEQTNEAAAPLGGKTDVQQGRRDRLTGLASRAALEEDLDALWEKDPDRTKPLCLAMIDLDQFARVNERCGQEAADRVLRALSQLLAGESGHHATVSRFSGQRFALLFEDSETQHATEVVERIRQLIELSRLRHDEDEIRVTVSCGVTESTADDLPASLFSRAESTLREAKRYGRNRTFVFENGYPVPVVPPSLSLEEKSFAV